MLIVPLFAIAAPRLLCVLLPIKSAFILSIVPKLDIAPPFVELFAERDSLFINLPDIEPIVAPETLAIAPALSALTLATKSPLIDVICPLL